MQYFNCLQTLVSLSLIYIQRQFSVQSWVTSQGKSFELAGQKSCLALYPPLSYCLRDLHKGIRESTLSVQEVHIVAGSYSIVQVNGSMAVVI